MHEEYEKPSWLYDYLKRKIQIQPTVLICCYLSTNQTPCEKYYCLSLLFYITSLRKTVLIKADLPSQQTVWSFFNTREIDTMYDGVRENIGNYKFSMHKQSLKNNIPLSLWQSPVLPGMKFKEKQDPCSWTHSMLYYPPLEMNWHSILYKQLVSLIKTKISSVELTKFSLNDWKNMVIRCNVWFTLLKKLPCSRQNRQMKR